MNASNRFEIEALARYRQNEIEKDLHLAALLDKPHRRSLLARPTICLALAAAIVVVAALITAGLLAYLHWAPITILASSILGTRVGFSLWPDLKVDIKLILEQDDLVAFYEVDEGTNEEYHRLAI